MHTATTTYWKSSFESRYAYKKGIGTIQPSLFTALSFVNIGFYLSEIRARSFLLSSIGSDTMANPQEYRFGFNGMPVLSGIEGEKDPEITGQEGSHYTAAFWEYDTRIARRWNVDPVTYPWQSSYATFNNNPIVFTDPLGLFGTRDSARAYKKRTNIRGRIKESDDGTWYIRTRTNGQVFHTYRDVSQIDRANIVSGTNADKMDFVFTDCVWIRYGNRLTSKSKERGGYNVPGGRSLYSINTDDLPKAGRGRQLVRTPKQLYDAVDKVRDMIDRFKGGLQNMESEKVEKEVETKNKEINTPTPPPMPPKKTEIIEPKITYDTVWGIEPFTGQRASDGKFVNEGDTSYYLVIERHNGIKVRSYKVNYD